MNRKVIVTYLGFGKKPTYHRGIMTDTKTVLFESPNGVILHPRYTKLWQDIWNQPYINKFWWLSINSDGITIRPLSKRRKLKRKK